ncbi:Uncharacterised protein [Bordetella pertussis]|nr:Uncharacterised protein [Bordetella pertussis]
MRGACAIQRGQQVELSLVQAGGAKQRLDAPQRGGIEPENTRQHGHGRDVQVGAFVRPLGQHQVDVVFHYCLDVKYLYIKIKAARSNRRRINEEPAGAAGSAV